MADPIAYQSPLTPEFLTNLLGKNTTTSTGGDLDPLRSVFASAMQGANAGSPEMQQLITSIFQQGARDVPSLIGAYANATGTRSTNNSGLSLALTDLNRQMTTQAAQAVLDNQNKNRQIAGQAGSSIAEGTKSSTVKTRTGTNPFLPVIAGWALNKAGAKGGFIDKATDKLADTFGMGPSSTGMGINSPGNIDNISGISSGPAYSSIPSFDTSVSDVTPNGIDLSGGIGAAPTAGFDTSNINGLDLPAGGSSGGDFSGIPMGESGDAFISANPGDFGPAFDAGPDLSGISDLFGLANGGMIPAGIRTAPRKGYADGGMVSGAASGVDAPSDGGTLIGTPEGLKKKGTIGIDNPLMADTSNGGDLLAGNMSSLNITGGGGGGGSFFQPSGGGGGGSDLTQGGGGGGGGDSIGSSNDATSIGTVAQNQKAIDTLVSTLISLTTGIPGVIVGPVISAISKGLVTVGDLKADKSQSQSDSTSGTQGTTGVSTGTATGTVSMGDLTAADNSQADNGLSTAADAASVSAAAAQGINGLTADGIASAVQGFVDESEADANQGVVSDAAQSDAATASDAAQGFSTAADATGDTSSQGDTASSQGDTAGDTGTGDSTGEGDSPGDGPGSDGTGDGDGGSDGGGGGGGAGGGGCVIATALVASGAWAPSRKVETINWCESTLHGKEVGEAIRRGYQVVASLIAVPEIRKGSRLGAYYARSFESVVALLQHQTLSRLQMLNARFWLAIIIAVGKNVSTRYARRTWMNLYRTNRTNRSQK